MRELVCLSVCLSVGLYVLFLCCHLLVPSLLCHFLPLVQSPVNTFFSVFLANYLICLSLFNLLPFSPLHIILSFLSPLVLSICCIIFITVLYTLISLFLLLVISINHLSPLCSFSISCSVFLLSFSTWLTCFVYLFFLVLVKCYIYIFSFFSPPC